MRRSKYVLLLFLAFFDVSYAYDLEVHARLSREAHSKSHLADPAFLLRLGIDLPPSLVRA